MVLLSGLLAATLGVAEVGPEPIEGPEAAAASESIRYAIVLDEAIEPSAGLPEELALRLSDRAITSARDAAGYPEGPYIWVEVDDVGTGAVRIRLIVSDGRLFSRTVDTTDDQRARIVAGSVANMIDAIEGNRLAPQQTGVEVPTPEPTPDEPNPPEPDPPEPESVTEPSTRSPLAPTPIDPEPSAWLGVVGSGAGVFGVGAPTAVAGPTGLGGSLGAQWLHRTAAIVGLDLRATGWRSAGVSLTRLRVSVTAGYAWRPGRFELLGAIGPTVEATLVDAELFTPSGRRRDATPLVGGRLLVRPSYTVAKRSTLRLLVGVEAEAAGAAEARSPPGAIQIHRRRGDGFEAIARAGGFELAVALVVELRVALGLKRS